MGFKDIPTTSSQMIEIKSFLQNLSNELSKIKSESVPKNGFYTSSQVKTLLQISDEKLSLMRSKNEIVYLYLSDKLYRYPVDQAIFKIGKQ